MRITPFVLAVFFTITANAQLRLRVVIESEPSTHKSDSLFVAGSFNAWNPHDKASAFQFILKSGFPSVELNLKPGFYEYKVTRGGWDKVEKSSSGFEISNREIKLTKDTTVYIKVEAWSDDFKDQPQFIQRRSTASSHVRVYDSAFNVPQLGRKKGIWVYLPPGYENGKKDYAVLYMHDGQNLFDEKTSSFGQEWAVDETLDSMIATGARACIVVGINNDAFKRMNEYNPYDNDKFGDGEGNKYVEFIVQTLKPYIDLHFRTKKSEKNTYIAGSSMGGLISLYAILIRPDVFGGAGVFSPAFWTAKGIEEDVNSLSRKVKGKIYFYSGGKEGETMVPDMQRIKKIFDEKSLAKTIEVVDEEALHNEKAWRRWFPEFYAWITKGQ